MSSVTGSDSGATPAGRLEAELFEPLREPLPPVKLPWSHALAAWISAAAMALVVAFYLALMAGCLWFTLDYLVAHGRLLFEGTARGSPVAYVVLGLCALGTALLLVKPLFHGSPPFLAAIELKPSEQPLLYEYVRRLCRTLQTPTPARISVNLAANASASVRRRLRKGFRPELEMVLGLPLLAAMDVREASSVMAHELGHFTRRRSGQVLGLVNAANVWFARAVYERDRFDLWLERLCTRPPWLLRLPFLLARLVVRIGRGVLWVFMGLGRLGSCMVSRDDEYNSDRYAARLCGADAHVAALHRTSTLAVVLEVALADVRRSWEDKRLPDDLPLVVAARSDRLSREQRNDILASIRKEKHGWLSTHPGMADRIRAVRSLKTAAPVRSGRPASALVVGFPALCRRATTAFYQHVLEDELETAALVPAESIVREQGDLSEAQEALRRYYQGEVLLIRPIYPSAAAARAPEDDAGAHADLIDARREALESSKDFQKAIRSFAGIQGYLYEMILIRQLLEARIQLDPRPDLGLDVVDFDTVEACERGARGTECKILGDLVAREALARTRLTRALQLLRSPVMEKVREAGETERIDRLLAASAALERVQPTVRAASWQLRVLLTFMQLDQENRHLLLAEVDRHARALRESLASLRTSLSEVPYPFEHAKRGATIAGYLFDEPRLDGGAASVAGAAMQALERIDLLIWRVLAQLARTAERVESALGFAPPIDPPEPTWEDPAPDRPPLHTHPALQAPVAALVLGLIVALGYGVTEAAPRFAVLPKHDRYRPVMVSARWTPPPREDVWHSGLRPYQPRGYQPGFVDPGWPNPNYGNPTHTGIQIDQWGRPIIPDPWGGRSTRDEWGRPIAPDPWGRPTAQDAWGRPAIPDPTAQPGYPSNWQGHPGMPGYNPNRHSNPSGWPGTGPSPYSPRQPGYGPSIPQPGGFGPSPGAPWTPRR